MATTSVIAGNIDFTTLTAALNTSTFITTVTNTGAGGGSWRIYNMMGIKVAVLGTGAIPSTATGASFTISLPNSAFTTYMSPVAHEVLNSGASMTWQTGATNLIASSTINFYVIGGTVNGPITVLLIGN